ncbi:general stress protein YciG [Chryseomicrobium aureum]|uniref:hypothetical protein n=1 Tax=Chryseomicrobium aureum TaxID=1441723 RepID=UPI001958EE1A|nr:hypothetical protein [Chryseomicrobium aureum]MBM7706405.1 general stress protein YciG [Chryseomicrobium aureum]
MANRKGDQKIRREEAERNVGEDTSYNPDQIIHEELDEKGGQISSSSHSTNHSSDDVTWSKENAARKGKKPDQSGINTSGS